jgi:hypothetical protein
MLNLSNQPNLPEADCYVDRHGRAYFLKELDEQQQALIREIREFAAQKPEWTEFENWWLQKVSSFYESRGLSRQEITQTTAWRIARDLGSRIGLDEGWMREGDYRNELERLIVSRYGTRREFCNATGLSEDMLSHVLAGRKNLGIETLTDALKRIGFTLHIAPLPTPQQ